MEEDLMAVAVEQNFPGATLEQYDAVIEAMDAGPAGSPHFGGALFHWAAVTGDGFRVVDVWETREQFERFAQEQIVPNVQKVGLREPETRFTDIHNYYVGG